MNDTTTQDTSASEAKAPRFCSKDYDLDSGEAAFSFGNGTKLSINISELSDDIKAELMFHGAMQKIGDSYAGAKGDFTSGITSAQAVIDQLLAGEWRASRAAGEAKPRVTELAEAIARLKGVDLDRAVAAVQAATDDQRKGWRKNAQVSAVIAEIRADKARAKMQKAGEELDITI